MRFIMLGLIIAVLIAKMGNLIADNQVFNHQLKLKAIDLCKSELKFDACIAKKYKSLKGVR